MRNRGRLRLRDICGISHIQVRENERMEANNACVMDSSDRPDCIILAKPAARAACAMRACGATMAPLSSGADPARSAAYARARLNAARPPNWSATMYAD